MNNHHFENSSLHNLLMDKMKKKINPVLLRGLVVFSYLVQNPFYDVTSSTSVISLK